MITDGETMTMSRRNPPKRTSKATIQVRTSPEMTAKLEELLRSLEFRGVSNTRGVPMTRTDLLVYWLKWLTSMSPDEQAKWARTYHTAFVSSLDRPDDRPQGNPRHVRGPDVTMPLKPSNGGATKEDHHAPERKPAPARPRRK